MLRGPQGTLFGRNTSAGLISIITAKPRFTPEVSGQLDVGNYDLRRSGERHGPAQRHRRRAARRRLGEARRLPQGRRSPAGDVNDRDRWMMRGQVLFQPNDDFSFRLIARLFAAQRGMLRRAVPAGAGCHAPAVARGPSTIAAIERGLGANHQRRSVRREVVDHSGPKLSQRRQGLGNVRRRRFTISAGPS